MYPYIREYELERKERQRRRAARQPPPSPRRVAAEPPRRARLRRTRFVAAAALALVAAQGAARPERAGAAADRDRAPLPVETLRVQGLERRVHWYRPAGAGERPALVVALHGSGGDGERLRLLTGRAFERVADRAGFLVAYPDALGGQWSECRAAAPHHAALSGIDDVAFLRAVVRRAESIAGGELSGAFVAGYSGGGHLVFRAALEAPGSFDAFAAVGAHLPVAEERDCVPAGRPVSLFLASGTADPINPWEGGEVRAPVGSLGHVLSARETAGFFAALAGAEAPPSEKRHADADPGDGTRVETLRWTGSQGREVVLLAVHGGGHTLPGPASAFPAKLVGRTSRDVDGAASIWRFFERHRRPAGSVRGEP